MFLTQNGDGGPVVYDACCGPETGDRLLSSYAAKILDSVKPPKTESKTGTLASIYDGPGVSALAVSAFFDPKVSRVFPFQESMMKMLSQFGTPQPPCFGLPTSDGGVTVTFTLIPNPSANFKFNTWTINIMRFHTLDKMQENYKNREEMLKNRQDLGGNETVNLTCKGGFRMFNNA
jgi:hypothetical protein